jgi:hypothetical protein
MQLDSKQKYEMNLTKGERRDVRKKTIKKNLEEYGAARENSLLHAVNAIVGILFQEFK